jgi:hypothetical protein
MFESLKASRFQCVATISLGVFLGGLTACQAPDVADIEQTQQAINGEVVFPDNSCDSIAPMIKELAPLARGIVQDRWQEFAGCLANSYLSATGDDAERIANLMGTDVPTQVTCQSADEIKALARAPYSYPDEIMFLNRDSLAYSSAAGTLGLFLHEIAHTKRYQHHDTDRDVAAMGAWEYRRTIPESVSMCGAAVNLGIPLDAPLNRQSLPDETTLGAIGDGEAGYPYPVMNCGEGAVISAISGTAVAALEKLTISCRKPGLLVFQNTASVGWSSPSGTLQSVDCGPGNVMVGFDAYSESDIHGIYPLRASESSVRAGTPSYSNPGGIGGWDGIKWSDPTLFRSASRVCPSTMALTGVRPRMSRHVKRLEFICQTLDAAKAPVEKALGSTSGSSTGSTWHEERCAGRTAIFSIEANTSDRVHRIGALCRSTTCTSGCAKPYLAGHGGWAGLARKDQCMLNELVVGLNMSSTATGVEGYSQICAPKATWAAGDPSGTRTLTWRGGTTSVATQYLCPVGQFLEGWRIATGENVNTLQPLCRKY